MGSDEEMQERVRVEEAGLRCAGSMRGWGDNVRRLNESSALWVDFGAFTSTVGDYKSSLKSL